MNVEKQRWVYICSDSEETTAEALAKATIRQFQLTHVQLKYFLQLQDEEEIRAIVNNAVQRKALIIYTIVQPELREMMRIEAALHDINAVDVLGPMMQGFVETFHTTPNAMQKVAHPMDEDYYRRIEAIEYTVRNDDGKSLTELPQGDIILLGVSRTSKTPLSVYLAHKGFKVANIPIVPEVKPPDILKSLPKKRLIGLTMTAASLVEIRKARLNDLGLYAGAKYSDLARVEAEISFANEIMESLSCCIIDVTNRAIEEISEIIIDYVQ